MIAFLHIVDTKHARLAGTKRKKHKEGNVVVSDSSGFPLHITFPNEFCKSFVSDVEESVVSVNLRPNQESSRTALTFATCLHPASADALSEGVALCRPPRRTPAQRAQKLGGLGNWNGLERLEVWCCICFMVLVLLTRASLA